MRYEGSWDDDVDEEQDGSAAIGFDLSDVSLPAGGVEAETDWCGGDGGDLSIDPPGKELDVIFTVTNPSGTLAASVGVGGRIRRVDVNDTSGLDEAQLSHEIVELATMARDKARAAQHEVTAELMRQLGQDRANVSALLRHSIDLPTYECASARQAEIFAARYRAIDD